MRPLKWLARRVINAIVRLLTGIICKVDAGELRKIPLQGPIIIIVNHVNFLELPIVYTRIPSDLGTGFSKVENWEAPVYRLLFENWNMIPIERESIDVTAIRKGLEALEGGCILFITPEGTRSHDGRLQQGKPGVVMMAERSGAPVWPIACYGGEKFSENVKRLRRTDYHVAVGNPFYVETNGDRVSDSMRQQVVDEMMYQLAALLPPEYRGHYSYLNAATEKYLRFSDPTASNLYRYRASQPGSTGDAPSTLE